jgi:hypothetical protein
MEKVIALILTIMLILCVNQLKSENYETAESGSWTSASTWINGNIVIPPYKNVNKDTFIIKHDVTLNDDFSGNVDVEFHVSNNSTLMIVGNFNVGNNCKIVVEDGSHFIVTGFIDLSPSPQHQGTLTVNGSITVDGGLKGYGTLEGSGTANITGDMIGMTYNNFTGTIMVDGEVISGPVIQDLISQSRPTNFWVSSTKELDKWRLTLTWDYQPVSHLQYDFIGYQIFRHEGGANDIFEIQKGLTEPYFNGDQEKYYVDPDLFLDGTTPSYYVRAIYQHKDISTDYKYSLHSLLFDLNPLPIDLLYFDAFINFKQVNFTWATASESNNDYFTIEESANARDWEAVAYVEGAGNSNRVIHYSKVLHVDKQGIIYYRLKQTDFDGRFEYFNPLALQISSSSDVTDIVKVAAEGNRLNIWFMNPAEQGVLMVADLQGKILAQRVVQAEDYLQNIEVDFQGKPSWKIICVSFKTPTLSIERKIQVR